MNQNQLHFSQKAYLNFTDTRTHERTFISFWGWGSWPHVLGLRSQHAFPVDNTHTFLSLLFCWPPALLEEVIHLGPSKGLGETGDRLLHIKLRDQKLLI